MAQFLRDKQVFAITLDEDALTEIFRVLERRATALQTSHLEKNESLVVFSVIRFDGKGYRVFSSEELLYYFRSSKSVERIVMTFQTGSAVSTNNAVGSFIDLWFDGSDPNQCWLRVSSDDSDWVDASFSTLEDSLRNLKNRHGWSRSWWFGLLIQLSAVVLGFILSVWAAAVITPRIPVENAFVIVFLFLLLLFSNTWEYLKSSISNTINTFLPNIEFYRPDKDKYRWLMQSLIAAMVAAILLYVFHFIIQHVGDELSRLFTNGA